MAGREMEPQVRFKGFHQKWEPCKLGDISERVTRKNLNLESTLPLTISAQDGLVDQIEFFNSQVASKDISNYYLLKNGEFAYNKSTSQDYPVGAVKRLDRYDMGVLSTLYILFMPKNTVNSEYLATYFDSTCWHKEITIRATEGARNHGLLNISPNDFFDIELKKPQDIKEQEKVGVFLRRINELIAQEQTKYGKLQIIKKSMLEKMFPKGGADVPEIRVKGFTGAWEQRKVGEVTEELNQYTTFQSGFPLLTSSRSGLMMQNEYRDSISTDNQDTIFSVVPMGACTYRHMSDDDIFHFNLNEIVENGLVSREYPVFTASKGNNLSAIIQYLNSSAKFRAFCREQKKGGTRTRLYYKSLCTFELLLPSEKEQDQIAAVLKKTDDFITLHQQELEKLKNLKKALLERMFV